MKPVEVVRDMVEATSFRFSDLGVVECSPRSRVEEDILVLPDCLNNPHKTYVTTLSLASALDFFVEEDMGILMEMWERAAIENRDVFRDLPVDFDYFLGIPEKRWTAKESLYSLKLYRECSKSEHELPFSDTYRWWFLVLTSQFYGCFPLERLSYTAKGIVREIVRLAVFMSSRRSVATWVIMRDQVDPLVRRIFHEVGEPDEVKALLWYVGRLSKFIFALTSTNFFNQADLRSVLETLETSPVEYAGRIRNCLYSFRKELVCYEG